MPWQDFQIKSTKRNGVQNIHTDYRFSFVPIWFSCIHMITKHGTWKWFLLGGWGGGGTLKTQHHFLPVPEAQVKCELQILLQDYLTFKGVGTFDFFFARRTGAIFCSYQSFWHFPWRQHGGSMAEWLGHKTWNPEAAGSSPALTTQLELFLGRPQLNSLVTLGCLLLGGFFKSVMLQYLFLSVFKSGMPEKKSAWSQVSRPLQTFNIIITQQTHSNMESTF